MKVKNSMKMFFLPWVRGTNGFDAPFSLLTRHGRLVFVFIDKNAQYEAFLADSSEDLKPGFSLITGMAMALDARDLARELAKKLNGVFEVVVQGTESFDTYMDELCEGTIWPP